MTDQPAPPDPARRRFFRQFAGDVVTTVGSVMGAAQSLQQVSAEAARDLLSDGSTAPAPAVAPASAAPDGTVVDPADASIAGYRTPFRWDGDVCRVVDQRRLPDLLVDLEVRGAADAVGAINDGALIGAPVQAQVAAVTLAIIAAKATGSRAFARRATIRGAANALRQTRQGSAPMAAALDRMLALVEQLGTDADGDTLAAALKDEAERIIGEASDDHGALVDHVLAALPAGDQAPLRVLVAGSTGPMGCGQFGGALSAVITAHHAGRPIHALVAEGRPAFEGSRVAAWELRQAGVPYAVVTDAAAPGCIAAGEVAAVLVGADRIAANGDVIAPAGTYPLAMASAAAGVPFLVCATTNAVDLAIATGADAAVEEGRPSSVLRAAGTRVAPEGTQVRNPLQDRVPAALVTAIVTETGVLSAPFGPELADAVAAAMASRASSAGVAAMLAQRATAAEAGDATGGAGSATGGAGPAPGGAAPASGAASANPPVDVAALRTTAPGPTASLPVAGSAAPTAMPEFRA